MKYNVPCFQHWMYLQIKSIRSRLQILYQPYHSSSQCMRKYPTKSLSLFHLYSLFVQIIYSLNDMFLYLQRSLKQIPVYDLIELLQICNTTNNNEIYLQIRYIFMILYIIVNISDWLSTWTSITFTQMWQMIYKGIHASLTIKNNYREYRVRVLQSPSENLIWNPN